MTTDRFGYWPEGQAYRTPAEPPKSPPICPRCSSRHLGPTPNCELPNDQEPEDDAATA